jgi:hypothetical protein
LGAVGGPGGHEGILAEHRPLLLLELHGLESEKVAWETFKKAEYSLHQMTGDYPPIESPEGLGWKAYVMARCNPYWRKTWMHYYYFLEGWPA